MSPPVSLFSVKRTFLQKHYLQRLPAAKAEKEKYVSCHLQNLPDTSFSPLHQIIFPDVDFPSTFTKEEKAVGSLVREFSPPDFGLHRFLWSLPDNLPDHLKKRLPVVLSSLHHKS